MAEEFNMDIIIIGQQPWDTEIGSNCKDIAVELSKNNRVLYVNSPLDRITLLRSKNGQRISKRLNVIKGRENGLVKIDKNLWNYYPDCIVESINWIKFHNIFDVLNRFNNKKLAKSITKALDILGFRNFLLFNDNEIFKGFYLKEFLKPKLSIYYSRDYMIGVDYWKRHGTKFEPLLIAKSDICFANSSYLSDYCKQYNPASYYVGQGCDIDEFQNGEDFERPKDIETIKNKIIGYVGSLNGQRLDILILEHIALSFPDCTILLVGPEDDLFKISHLHQIENIYFTGQKSVNELPAYVKAFDVCINPQLINAITIGNYPRKIDEYLSTGKPIVATSTKTMEVFKDYVYMANTKEDYISFINQSLLENDSSLVDRRKVFAATHTWENSVGIMKEKILLILNSTEVLDK
jgi:teichuronic acid biosynthesis glycosyltransferase TuaH